MKVYFKGIRVIKFNSVVIKKTVWALTLQVPVKNFIQNDAIQFTNPKEKKEENTFLKKFGVTTHPHQLAYPIQHSTFQ